MLFSLCLSWGSSEPGCCLRVVIEQARGQPKKKSTAMRARRAETSHALWFPPILRVRLPAEIEVSAPSSVPRMARSGVPRVAHVTAYRALRISARGVRRVRCAREEGSWFSRWRASKPLTSVASVARVSIEAGAGTNCRRLPNRYDRRSEYSTARITRSSAVDRLLLPPPPGRASYVRTSGICAAGVLMLARCVTRSVSLRARHARF